MEPSFHQCCFGDIYSKCTMLYLSRDGHDPERMGGVSYYSYHHFEIFDAHISKCFMDEGVVGTKGFGIFEYRKQACSNIMLFLVSVGFHET